MTAAVQEFFHEPTNTWTYIVACPQTKKCAIIDSVWDYDAPSGCTSTKQLDELCAYVDKSGYTVQWILDTHIHADHLTGMGELKKRFPNATTGIGSAIKVVLRTFGEMFEEDYGDGSQFDRLFADGDTFGIGELECKAIATPGHTPADMTYIVGGAAFTGDSIFLPDAGTARCDFPGGSAATLWESITRRIFALPDGTTLYVGHDYGADGKRAFASHATVGDERARNKHVGGEASEDKFIEWRHERDATLGMPKLIIPSLQVR